MGREAALRRGFEKIGEELARQPIVDLDTLFDTLNGGIDPGARAGRVQLVDIGPSVELRIDTAPGTGAGDGIGDVKLLTFSGLNSVAGLSIGTGASDDVNVGG